MRPRLGLALAACLLAAACSRHDPSWRTKDIENLVPDLRFETTDDSGTPRTAADYRGRIVLLYFGYTHCPDVCPTTLTRLAKAVAAMGPDSRQVKVLMVTVDPARDTVSQLNGYVHAFDPDFAGLRGSDAELERLAKRYRISYSRGKPDAQGEYDVAHSSGVFVFDERGKARLLIQESDPADAITGDLEQLYRQSKKTD
jgi:protein SCO1